MKKRRFTAPAAVALSLALLSGTFSAYAASDISGHWAESSITKWLDAGKISGYEDGTFHPDQPMTRAEFATLLANVVTNEPATPVEGQVFEDVAEGQWFYAPVMKLLGLGIVAEGTAFHPNDYITRQDMMTMASRAFHVVGYQEDTLDAFTDGAQVSEYAKTAVSGFVEEGYVSGYPDNTLRPLAQITRAECVQILDGLNLVHEAGSLEDIMERVYAGVEGDIPAVSNTRITDETAEYYLGLPNLQDVEEALGSDAMMSSVAHSVCLVRAKDGVDVEALMETIRTSVNPQKWICVSVDPEDVVVVNQGNLILLAMNPEYSQAIADSFLALDLSEETPEEEKLTPDANGLIEVDGYYMDFIGELRPDAIVRFADKVDSLSETYLQNASNIYYAVVPSKSYFVNDRLETPFDYEQMNQILDSNIESAKKIDLTGTLELTDYCKTDPHWKQENLQKVLDKLGESLGFSVDLNTFTVNTAENFTGQHGYNKENFPSEQISYLTNAAIDNAVVDNFQKPDFKKVYEVDALSTDTPYNLFLSGPTPLLTITNAEATSGKDLVIFRDSFACSLVPLLVEEYETITLVDIRYMTSTLLPQYVDFTGKDVLFLYNDQVINHSEMLR